MALTKEAILKSLKLVRPDGRGNIVDSGHVKNVAVCEGFVRVRVAKPEGIEAGWLKGAIGDFVRQAADAAGDAVQRVEVEFVDESAPSRAEAAKKGAEQAKGRNEELLPGVGHVIAVGAGKGGVGKSTVSANLAVGLARRGNAVGLVDGDIYGPSMPTLMGLEFDDAIVRENRLQTFYAHGVKTMTMGKLVDPEKPLIWRGPMAHGAFKQLIERTDWGELDYLIIDLPPGTGDVPLSMTQMLSLTGAIIVCTPQKVAQDDAVRAVRMFQQLDVDVLGVVENMSYFIGDDGKEYDLFGRGGAESMAARMGLAFLGAVPISMALREHGDKGEPVWNFERAGDEMRGALEHMTRRVVEEAASAALKQSAEAPSLSIS